MRINLTLNGGTGHGTPIIFHSEVLADRLSPQAKYVAELSGKSKRTDAEELELSRREWLGGMYSTPEDGPVLPTWNVVRSVQDAAKASKLGKTIERGVFPTVESVPLAYDGPRDLDELWRTGLFSIRKGVKIGGRRVMRTRPIFSGWSATVELNLDPDVTDFDTFSRLAAAAGRYYGIGDFRSGRYGRYVATCVLLENDGDLVETMDASAAVLDAGATETMIRAATLATAGHEERNHRKETAKK